MVLGDDILGQFRRSHVGKVVRGAVAAVYIVNESLNRFLGPGRGSFIWSRQ